MKLVHLLPLALLSGCVISPLDDSSVADRLEPLDFSGYAYAANAPLQLWAFDHDRGTFELVRSFRGSDRAVGRDVRMYGWTASDVLLGERWWRRTSAGCSTAGAARFRVTEETSSGTYRLKTFDEAGHDCLSDEIAAGTDFYDAGAECYTGDEIRLTVGGQCATVPSSDTTPPFVQLRISDGVSLSEARSDRSFARTIETRASRIHRFDADAFDAQGAAYVQIDGELAVMCGDAPGPSYLRLRYFDGEPPTYRPGAVVDVSAGVSEDVDVRAVASSVCPPGAPPRSATGRFFATGWNAHDGETRTPQIRFDATF